MSFSGFPLEAVQFFKDIQANNHKTWFEAHKNDYLTYVQEPAVEFVLTLGPKLQALSPDIQFDAATNGSGSIMRIYRDIRFSKDKTPYKDWLGIGFWGGSKKNRHSGVYFGIFPEGGSLHVGSHEFSKEFLTVYRAAIADERGEALQTALAHLDGHFAVQGEKLKTVPREFPADHPRGELLKHKSLYASTPIFSPAELNHSDLIERCLAAFRAALPFHQWLVAVGKTT